MFNVWIVICIIHIRSPKVTYQTIVWCFVDSHVENRFVSSHVEKKRQFMSIRSSESDRALPGAGGRLSIACRRLASVFGSVTGIANKILSNKKNFTSCAHNSNIIHLSIANYRPLMGPVDHQFPCLSNLGLKT